MPKGKRVDGLKDLPPEQDIEAIRRYYEKHPFVQSLSPEHRFHWFEIHKDHAKRRGTNISEQMVISQQAVDRIDSTDSTDELLAYLMQPID